GDVSLQVGAEAEVEDLHLVARRGGGGCHVAHAEWGHRIGAPFLVGRDQQDTHGYLPEFPDGSPVSACVVRTRRTFMPGTAPARPARMPSAQRACSRARRVSVASQSPLPEIRRTKVSRAESSSG